MEEPAVAAAWALPDASLLQAFLDQSQVLIWLKSERGVYTFANRPWLQEFDLEDLSGVVGKTDFDLFSDIVARQLRANDLDVLGGHHPVQMTEYTHRSQVPLDDPRRMRAWQVIKFPFHAPDGTRYVGGMAFDATERMRHEEALQSSLSITDPLTGLFNRRGFELMVEPSLGRARRRGSSATLLHAHFIGFSRLIDHLGTHAGDSLAAVAALTLRNAFRETDVVARIGMDSFAVFAADTDCDAALIGRRLEQAVAQIDPDSVVRAQLTFKVGLIRCDADASASLPELLAQAERQAGEGEAIDR